MRYHLIEAHRPPATPDKPSRWPHHVECSYTPNGGVWQACWVDARGYRVGQPAYGATQDEARAGLPDKENVT